MIKRVCIGILAALALLPLVASFLYSVYLTVFYSDRGKMSPNDAYRLATGGSPGKQIYWLQACIISLCAWPFILWKRRRKQKTVRLARRHVTHEVQPPTALQDQLMLFMREHMQQQGNQAMLNFDSFLRP